MSSDAVPDSTRRALAVSAPPGPRDDPPPTDFASAFRSATDARGLSLERITYHLRQHGHDLSPATLSYWRTGRSAPQRHASISALGPLEEILGVERGSLLRLVPPRTPRPPGLTGEPVEASDVCEQSTSVPAMVADLGLTFDNGLRVISTHDELEIAADRRLVNHRVRSLVRATRDGVDRLPRWMHADDRDGYPFITAHRNCRIGQVREDPESAAVAVELILERPLDAGDTMLFEHSYGIAGSTAPVEDCMRECVIPMRELYIEARFAPSAVPTWVVEVTRPMGEAERVVPVDLVGGSVQRAAHDFGPGTWGLRWGW